METSWNVYDYPTPPEEKTKIIKGKLYVAYDFETEVPENWGYDEIMEDIEENRIEYEQSLDEIIDVVFR